MGGLRGASEDSDQITGPFLYTMTVLFDHSSMEIHKRAQILSAQKAAGSFAVEVGKQAEEIGWILDELGDSKFVRIIPTVWVIGRTRDEARDMSARVKRLWEGEPLPFAMQEESYLNPTLLVMSLPFGCYTDKTTIRLLARDFTVPVKAAVLMAPVQADYRGGGRPALTYVGRKGQLITVDIFDRRINNYNFIVAAESGAGKSFLLNNLCQNYYGNGALVRIIDIGGSYRKLCTLCSGRYIDIGEENLCLNPFDMGFSLDGEDRQSAMAYDYPAYTSSVRGQPLDGTGASVAIVISNDVLDSDIQAQFDDQGFTKTTGKLAPKVNRLLVNGGSPFDQTLSGESSLDVEQALGGAPGAAVTLVNLPTLSNEDVIAGYRAVVEANRFDIVSSSFGQCELFFGPAYNGGVDASDTYKVQEQLFMQGNAQGITFVASSGDGGALSCASTDIVAGSTADATLGVNYPASSAFVTSVGGGNLVTTVNFRTTESRYRAENGLGDPEIPSPVFGGNTVIEGAIFGAGGGRSALFAMPAWQRQVGLSGKARAQPDVGFFVGGCPGIAVQPCGPDRSGAILYVGGQVARVIGTSVAAPQFAGALALVRQFKGQRLGNINPLLYARAAQQNRAVTAPGLQPYNRGQAGFDGVYFANQPSVRYNYIFGNGSMNIRTLFEMTSLAPAGNPKSPSNP